MTGPANKLYTTTELHSFQERVEHALGVELAKLLEIESSCDRLVKAEHGLYKRLMDASKWLEMMQRCVVTDEPVVRLSTDVSTALWDARIL